LEGNVVIGRGLHFTPHWNVVGQKVGLLSDTPSPPPRWRWSGCGPRLWVKAWWRPAAPDCIRSFERC